MKVYGQLEKAQFENLSADPSSPPTGYIYFNTTSGKLRYYNGTSWVVINQDIYSGSATSGQVLTADGSGGASFQTSSSSSTQVIDFSVAGNYSLGGSTQTEVMLYRVPKQISISSAVLLVQTAGTSGTLTVDVQASTNNGSTWTSIFSTQPSAAYSSGSYYQATNAVISGSTFSVALGSLLRLNISAVQSGSPSGFELQLIGT